MVAQLAVTIFPDVLAQSAREMPLAAFARNPARSAHAPRARRRASSSSPPEWASAARRGIRCVVMRT
jgi:hypothetical protein